VQTCALPICLLLAAGHPRAPDAAQTPHAIAQAVGSVIVLLDRRILAPGLGLLIPHVEPHLLDEVLARLMNLEPPRAEQGRHVSNAVDDRIVGRRYAANAVVVKLRDETRRRRVDEDTLRDRRADPLAVLGGELRVGETPP